MGTLIPTANFSLRREAAPSPWLSDAVAGLGLVLFLASGFVWSILL
ncbi:MAG: hypothetical protein JOZ55_00645 [Alphaproteobacteria bacterium]|nr:hypothetical protein [Alphaproteobacteria bacterium]